MTTLRSGLIAMAMLVGVAIPTIPAAAADGARWANAPSIWQGLYAGVHLGHGESGPADGFVGGAQIGYNWQSGQIVYGLEADVSLADISFEQSFLGATFSGSIDWMATARGRLGFLVTPSVLVYGTAGFGIAGVSQSATLSFPGVVPFSGSGNDTETDIVYGLGLEAKFSETMSARIEYLAFSDLEIDIIRAAVNFRFGD